MSLIQVNPESQTILLLHNENTTTKSVKAASVKDQKLSSGISNPKRKLATTAILTHLNTYCHPRSALVDSSLEDCIA